MSSGSPTRPYGINLRSDASASGVDHASLFLRVRDADDPERTIAVAEAGLPSGEALPERCMLLTQVLDTACPAHVERFLAPGERPEPDSVSDRFARPAGVRR